MMCALATPICWPDLTSLVLTQLDEISYGMHFSVQCQEEVPFTDTGASGCLPEAKS